MNKDFYGRCGNQLLSRFTSNENNYNRLLSTLPDLVANFVSDVIDKGITASVVQVALNLNYLGYGQYEIVRLIATSDWKKPPRCEVLALIVKMIESI